MVVTQNQKINIFKKKELEILIWLMGKSQPVDIRNSYSNRVLYEKEYILDSLVNRDFVNKESRFIYQINDKKINNVIIDYIKYKEKKNIFLENFILGYFLTNFIISIFFGWFFPISVGSLRKIMILLEVLVIIIILTKMYFSKKFLNNINRIKLFFP
jgi:hypothetical protein